ncbi:hypothetical protein ACOKM5_43570 [Streptomyces sp. BH097]|uniref:hypothetical protein n=1 Tax=unclassified Streptomyces TaxID=2593676 RepID=UPI003BB7EF48
MARVTRARMNDEADYLEGVAARQSDEAAVDADQAARASTYDEDRALNRRLAANARSNAREYRTQADILRAGEIPEGYRFD